MSGEGSGRPHAVVSNLHYGAQALPAVLKICFRHAVTLPVGQRHAFAGASRNIDPADFVALQVVNDGGHDGEIDFPLRIHRRHHCRNEAIHSKRFHSEINC